MASAHPSGNFSINRCSRIEPRADQIQLRYVLDLAEIPTFQEMSQIDLDRDGRVSDSEIAEVVPEVRSMLPDLPAPPELDPEQARFRLYDSISTFFKNVTQSQPLVVVLEDLHWADRSSLLLLEFLAQEIHSIPLLLLGTYRDMEVARRHPLYQALGSLIREQRFARIQLHGLNQREVGQLLHFATGTAPPTGLVATVHGRTEGNPLFISEISRVLSQLEVKQGQDLLGAIPEGIKEAVSRRLDRLSEGCN